MAREKETIILISLGCCSIMVMAGHMVYIGGYTLPTLWEEGIQALPSKNLLLIGGFLIAKSWESRCNLVRVYDEKSFLEFFPALIAFTLVAAM